MSSVTPQTTKNLNTINFLFTRVLWKYPVEWDVKSQQFFNPFVSKYKSNPKRIHYSTSYVAFAIGQLFTFVISAFTPCVLLIRQIVYPSPSVSFLNIGFIIIHVVGGILNSYSTFVLVLTQKTACNMLNCVWGTQEELIRGN